MSLLPFPARDNIDDYYQTDDIYDFLGQGTFASVYKAVCRVDGEKVKENDELALKLISKRDLVSEKALKDITNEVEVLRRVDHPNCVRLLDYFQTASHVVIVMSYASGKELFQALRESDFSEMCVKSVMTQLLSALAYLHDKLRVVHRDIKPENVLVTPTPTGEYHVTIVDFGLARTFGRQGARRRVGMGAFVPVQRLVAFPPPRNASVESLEATDSPLLATPCGTLKYAAPETIHSITHSSQLSTTRELLPRVDVYAAGTLMYVMLCGALPFNDFSNKANLYREMENGPTFSGPRWESISPEAIDVNRVLLAGDPHKRPRAADALTFPWFTAAEGVPAERSLSTSQKMPVDTIIGEREMMIKAFDAMKPPESATFNAFDDEEAAPHPLPAGRVRDVPFGVHNQRKQKDYFDF